MGKNCLWLGFVLVAFSSCGISKRLNREAQVVINDTALRNAHVGISIYEPSTGRYWYNYQGDNYFVPASNTKIATCYAAMRYLGDSLVGGRLSIANDQAVEIYPSGDPTFLHPEFRYQPLYEVLKKAKVIRWDLTGWREQHWGSGWSWNDYDAEYMAERSPLPVYGNLMRFALQGDTFAMNPAPNKILFDVGNASLGYNQENKKVKTKFFRLERSLCANDFFMKTASRPFVSGNFPIRMDVSFVDKMLRDTLHADNVSTFVVAPDYESKSKTTVIYSQPTDSLLKPMMHRSDNFFAEQALLMVSNEVLGYMEDEKIIDTILKTDFKNLPQKPRWADGSGLSRYNLFTPQDFVAILQKMKAEFGMSRIREILPTGNEGTLSNYYKSDSAFLYAKTGTLSGVVALSGFLTTQKGRELIFSVLVNNHQASATQVRRAIEKFIQNLRKEY